MTETRSGFAAINGAALYYETAGSGLPLVFVHAGIADSRMWEDQFAAFADRYQVIRFDQRGFGKSEPVAGEYTFRDDLIGLLNYLNVKRAVLIGCSMGGGTCMDVTILHPERIAGLVMVGSGPGGFMFQAPDPPIIAQIVAAEAAKDLALLNELEIRLWFDGEGRTPDQLDQNARALVLAMNRLALEHEAKGLGQRKPPMEPNAEQRLGELNLPVLVVYGDRDEAYIHAAAAHMGERIKGARVKLMAGTAHLPNMERPAEFNSLLTDFLIGIS
jgi:pimeloyl-ACP methyl ester carboxylesterase